MKRIITAAIVTLLSFVYLLTPVAAFAQSNVLEPVCTGQGASAKVCKPATTEIAGPNGVIVKVARIVAVITGVASIIMIMVGGFKYVTSTGDSARVNSAKNTILYALIGLAVSILAPFIIGFIISKV